MGGHQRKERSLGHVAQASFILCLLKPLVHERQRKFANQDIDPRLKRTQTEGVNSLLMLQITWIESRTDKCTAPVLEGLWLFPCCLDIAAWLADISRRDILERRE